MQMLNHFKAGSSAHHKWHAAHEAYISSLKAFTEVLSSDEEVSSVLSSDESFFRLLDEVKVRKLCHYTRLARVLGLRDASSVSRWYNAQCAPDSFRRKATIEALKLVIANDVRRLREQKNRIGHLSMKEFSELEIEPLT